MNSTLNIHPISILCLLMAIAGLCWLVPLNRPAVEANPSSNPLSYLSFGR
ncbi:hypothetical protein PMG71_03460 [Roseofilum sp. BLCC_M154]|uniref:Uncharacterized protein n=1 Tax=Roseofilum acuticapitatum BLCC-M154 TaxID=3022444 RepID=A0ABT7ANK5_9CYAN|nr:hypothetical protein [Roseofilum acuticapitatum]MDJ1168481.1 hypothetical protein [Roseofilum acuticapitatum BLCC-M154]